MTPSIFDAHCHFFSAGFFRTLGRDLREPAPADAAVTLPDRLGWDPPGDDTTLSARWASELDRHGVSGAMLIASVPGDEAAVAEAAKRYPTRFAAATMVNPNAPDAAARAIRAFEEQDMRCLCLFPAMHQVRLHDQRVERLVAIAAERERAVFVHCGMLTIGARKKLGLTSVFDLRFGDPLAVARLANIYPQASFIIPHFGSGMLRVTLMAMDAAPNVYVDTSSSNSWMKYQNRLTLADVFKNTLDVAGPSRILFGTDSSYFPRGWQKPIYEEQRAIIDQLVGSETDKAAILGDNARRLLGMPAPPRT
jgi:uncharacterized protein